MLTRTAMASIILLSLCITVSALGLVLCHTDPCDMYTMAHVQCIKQHHALMEMQEQIDQVGKCEYYCDLCKSGPNLN